MMRLQCQGAACWPKHRNSRASKLQGFLFQLGVGYGLEQKKDVVGDSPPGGGPSFGFVQGDHLEPLIHVLSYVLQEI